MYVQSLFSVQGPQNVLRTSRSVRFSQGVANRLVRAGNVRKEGQDVIDGEL